VGRLAALAVMKDGSLLIADDTGGTIWRVSYTGSKDRASDPARAFYPPELFGRPSPLIRLRPGSKECEVSKLSAALLLQLMFVCLLTRLRAEPKHPLPMHN
jgi:hypothetical protein